MNTKNNNQYNKKKRPFNKVTYDKYDLVAKNKTIELFKKLNFDIKINPDPFGIDLLVYKNDEHIGYIEVECRENFYKLKDEYETIYIPYRKDKFLSLDKPVNYICWSSEFNQYYYINSKIIKKSPIIMFKLKGTSYEDEFFSIPKENIKFYQYS